jgi:hypothetical protein
MPAHIEATSDSRDHARTRVANMVWRDAGLIAQYTRGEPYLARIAAMRRALNSGARLARVALSVHDRLAR